MSDEVKTDIPAWRRAIPVKPPCKHCGKRHDEGDHFRRLIHNLRLQAEAKQAAKIKATANVR